MKRNNEHNQNFWISYADLMAGLLFIFILLLGAIVVKYVYAQNNLDSKTHQLEQNKKKADKVSDKLLTTQDALKAMRVLLLEEQKKNENASESMKLKESELIFLKNALLDTEKKLQNEQNISKNLHVKLSQTEENLSQAQANLSKAQDDLNQTQTKLEHSEKEIFITKDELAKINEKLLLSLSQNQRIVEDLNITKAKIQNLTGIKIRAIKILKNKLGNVIEVDEKSGAIRLPSAVLFDVDAYKIKEEAKEALKSTLMKYINTLLEDKELRNYIKSIVIEGYTDSSGSYLYNLELSQKRAFSVLAFLYKQKGVNRKLLRRYVSADGMAYRNVIKHDGKEDKEASRRIEVKFNISNKQAIHEIDTFLKSKH